MTSMRIRIALVVLLSLLLLAGFVILYAQICWGTYVAVRAGEKEVPSWTNTIDLTTVASALSGLLAGVVGIALGQRTPASRAGHARSENATNAENENATNAENENAANAEDRTAEAAERAKRFVFDDPALGWRNIVAAAYTLTYMIMAGLAVAVWLYCARYDIGAPSLLINLSGVALGLFLPTVRAFFDVPEG